MRAGLEDPEDLHKSFTLVGNAVADDDVDRLRLDRQVFQFAQAKLDVCVSELRDVLVGSRNHLRRHIDTDHLATLTDDPPGDESVDPGAGAQVEKRAPVTKPGMAGGQATAKTEVRSLPGSCTRRQSYSTQDPCLRRSRTFSGRSSCYWSLPPQRNAPEQHS